MTHAGFWVDGAVRLPEARHFDRNGWVIANWKDKQPDLDVCRRHFDQWDEVYWLDTTPRESLTPEELYGVLKVIWPSVETAHKHNDASWYVDDVESGVKVDWGNLTQHPPPVEPQWIRITRENVGQYLFRECRFRDADIDTWNYGKVAGWCETESRALVNSDFNDGMYVMNWNIVEVQA